jgi:hypothetical protein
LLGLPNSEVAACRFEKASCNPEPEPREVTMLDGTEQLHVPVEAKRVRRLADEDVDASGSTSANDDGYVAWRGGAASRLFHEVGQACMHESGVHPRTRQAFRHAHVHGSAGGCGGYRTGGLEQFGNRDIDCVGCREDFHVIEPGDAGIERVDSVTEVSRDGCELLLAREGRDGPIDACARQHEAGERVLECVCHFGKEFIERGTYLKRPDA